MFENVIGQSASARIAADFSSGRLPRSMLFCGPEASAKGTAALELARGLSCEEGSARWNCPCPSCAMHRALSHPDLLVLGPRQFLAEIPACRAVFLNDSENPAARLLFIRSVRKLLLRFSPVIWEGDAKVSKLNGSLELVFELLEALKPEETPEKLEKLSGRIVDTCAELVHEGGLSAIPVAHIRRGAFWLRLAPNGKYKVMIIENAEKMNDAARNSLLKILEEPPPNAAIILCSARHKTLLRTILSRVRPYYFTRRSQEDENTVLSRIFRVNPPENTAPEQDSAIVHFLNSFLNASSETLYPAAAAFLAALSGGTPDIAGAAALVIKAAAQFEVRSLFSVFVEGLYRALSARLKGAPPDVAIERFAFVKKYAEEARTAVEVYNQAPALALERLAWEICRRMS
ncbi:MAG: DNA polymerase III [Spirochaetaceae bacterium]|jgi:DNA polymerase-3 subunit gamma/tau|nr:DNA polymerase III [Spirochaetaceae bacterium]